MKRDQSYGIIPLHMKQGVWWVLLIQHHGGHWSFPKGHAESGESPQQVAERELFEETGLTIQSYLPLDTINEDYYFSYKGERIHKVVQYFLARVQGQVVIQELEIQASQWLTLAEAQERMTFKEGKRICQQVISSLKVLT